MAEDTNELKQLNLPGFEKLAPPNISEEQNEQNQPPATITPHQDLMPQTLAISAESSMTLRGVQKKLAEFMTSEEVLSMIAAVKPEILPAINDSLNNGIIASDTLLIRMAQIAEKNSSVSKMYEMFVLNKQNQSEEHSESQRDKQEQESINRIKAAIYKRLDNQRDKQANNADRFKEPEDDDIIDITPEEEKNDNDKDN